MTQSLLGNFDSVVGACLFCCNGSFNWCVAEKEARDAAERKEKNKLKQIQVLLPAGLAVPQFIWFSLPPMI